MVPIKALALALVLVLAGCDQHSEKHDQTKAPKVLKDTKEHDHAHDHAAHNGHDHAADHAEKKPHTEHSAAAHDHEGHSREPATATFKEGHGLSLLPEVVEALGVRTAQAAPHSFERQVSVVARTLGEGRAIALVSPEVAYALRPGMVATGSAGILSATGSAGLRPAATTEPLRSSGPENHVAPTDVSPQRGMAVLAMRPPTGEIARATVGNTGRIARATITGETPVPRYGSETRAPSATTSCTARLLSISRETIRASGRVELLFEVEATAPVAHSLALTLKLVPAAPALAVPRSALLDAASGTFVYLVHDGHYLRTPVKTGASDSSHIEISAGLRAGATVATAAVEQLWLTELRLTKGGGHSH